MMKRLIAACSLAALACAQPASAQDLDLTEREAAALARFAMPRAFESVQQKCRPTLPAAAYMVARGDTVRARLRAASEGSWEAARGAIVRLASREAPEMRNMLTQMPQDALQPFAEEMIAGMIVKEVKADSCGQINRVLELLDPLPAENLADLIAFAVIESQKDKG